MGIRQLLGPMEETGVQSAGKVSSNEVAGAAGATETANYECARWRGGARGRKLGTL